VPIGLKCIWSAMVIKMKEINRDSSKVFAHEADDTPHHSAINSQFMYNCNLHYVQL
jgi:hypothetical protein